MKMKRSNRGLSRPLILGFIVAIVAVAGYVGYTFAVGNWSQTLAAQGSTINANQTDPGAVVYYAHLSFTTPACHFYCAGGSSATLTGVLSPVSLSVCLVPFPQTQCIDPAYSHLYTIRDTTTDLSALGVTQLQPNTDYNLVIFPASNVRTPYTVTTSVVVTFNTQ